MFNDSATVQPFGHGFLGFRRNRGYLLFLLLLFAYVNLSHVKGPKLGVMENFTYLSQRIQH